MADVHGIGSACAEYQWAFIESRLWRNASPAKEQHAADISRWWLKGCFCLSSLRTTYTALFITFDSELEWCCHKSVQDERCINVVDYSLVVAYPLESRFVRGYVRNDLGKAVVVFFGKQLNGAENERQAAASR
jgi:hypothetical protein